MAKEFIGSVQVVVTREKDDEGVSRQVIGLEKAAKGKYNSKNVAELVAFIDRMSVEHKLPVSKWTGYWLPLGTREGANPPELVANRYGKPQVLFGDPNYQRPGRKASTKIVLS